MVKFYNKVKAPEEHVYTLKKKLIDKFLQIGEPVRAPSSNQYATLPPPRGDLPQNSLYGSLFPAPAIRPPLPQQSRSALPHQAQNYSTLFPKFLNKSKKLTKSKRKLGKKSPKGKSAKKSPKGKLGKKSPKGKSAKN